MKTQTDKDSKAKQMFFSVEDVTRFFNENPDRLVDYIEMGILRRVSIVGIHIAQLANKVGVPLKFGSYSYETLPRTFIKPSSFDNIGPILSMARMMFPSSPG